MRRVALAVLGVVAAIALVIFLAVVLSKYGSQGAPSSAPSSSPVVQPSAPPEETAPPKRDEHSEEEDADESHYEFEDVTCDTALGLDVATQIKARVFDFERYWIMPDSAEKQAGIEMYGTATYIENNRVYIDPTLELEQGPVSIGESSIYSCRVTGQGNVKISIIPDIQLHVSPGEGAPVVETTTGVVHRSVWSLEEGEWRIAYEDWG